MGAKQCFVFFVAHEHCVNEIFGGIMHLTDASIVWSDLKEQFDKISGWGIFSIHRDIGRLYTGSSTIFCLLF